MRANVLFGTCDYSTTMPHNRDTRVMQAHHIVHTAAYVELASVACRVMWYLFLKNGEMPFSFF